MANLVEQGLFVDSHCHLDRLDLSVYHNSLDEALAAAKAAQVGYILSPAVDLKTFNDILEIAKKHENISISVGVHPEELIEMPTLEQLISLGKNNLVAGVGEAGLDYAQVAENDLNTKLKQKELFRLHFAAAKALKKPLIVHSRAAEEDMYDMLKHEYQGAAGGVMHCFTDSYEMAKKVLDLNFYISFSGIITFKNAERLRDVCKKIPLDRILLETDAPYLAPVPVRGKSNTPEFLHYTAECIAALRGISVLKLADTTSENFFRLFKI